MSIVNPFSRKEYTEDSNTILHCAIDWAMQAGKIQLEKVRSRIAISTKSNVSDLVTEVDKACEELLLQRISAAFPRHNILGEETGQHKHSDAEWEWVIDPLDGTNNYAQGLPIFCVSIGVKHNGVTEVGVVYAPLLDDLFTAIRGQGASWNGKVIHVSHKRELCQCVLGTGFPYDKGEVGSELNNLDNVCRLLPQLRGLRRMGSAAYDLCCVACGMLDGYWEMNLKPWDACAGALIVQEAGGTVQSFRDDRCISIVASNKAISQLILDNIK